jgi:hypothetical protein
MFPKHKRIDDRKVVDECKKEYCEVCGKSTYRNGRIIDPHHIYTKGSSGPCIRENLIQLCWDCHYIKVPAGKYSKAFLLGIVAKRENTTVEEIEDKINRLRYGI